MTGAAAQLGDLDWQHPEPSTTRLAAFAREVSHRVGTDLTADYRTLWGWSVSDVDGFWAAVWDHFDLGPRPGPALADDVMPGATWFPGTTLNFTAEVFRGRDPDGIALVSVVEGEHPVEITWRELEREVGAFAASLGGLGVGSGDRVCGYLANGREAVVAFLATASIGGVWGLCGVDYPAAGAAARLAQLEPKVLVTARNHRLSGRTRDCSDAALELVALLPSLTDVVVVGHDAGTTYEGAAPGRPGAEPAFHGWEETVEHHVPLSPSPVAFDHPLWVLFSSGTTGKPKGIVHGHGGVTLEHYKLSAFHWDLGPDDRFFWHTTPSWMVWNFQVACLLSGCAIVCYDGSPTHPDPGALIDLAAATSTTVLGTSPAYIDHLRAREVTDLGHPGLRLVGVSGSVFAPDLHQWFRSRLGPGVQIVSSSGGTDVVTAFAAGAPSVPVWLGELSAPCLGVALDAVDGGSGIAVRGEPGELVVRRPMPSMPLYFWGDEDGSRYREAYFDELPGLWRHGDRITVTDRGSVVIHGRSDATLNRRGVRMGPADICGPVEALPEVVESLVVGVETDDGGYWMPLFVVLADDVLLDDALRDRITDAIRGQASPRHVPDEVVAVPAIPHTRTGKKLEVPVKRLFLGESLDAVADAQSIDDPAALRWFAEFAAEWLATMREERAVSGA